ncbi:hypothetical protein [Paenibacillus periandrae]|uniref:hypothetical protein n=1 Tax=Paenibacillus periandrae TaxID=1761741 RepID=UPI001F09F58C|nr:hypothetical protein [Paenibacillus periandrae]
MGNRTFLSVTNIDTVVVEYEHVAFETNNFLAPLWFCLVSQEQYGRYREQLLASWSLVQPHLEDEELEDLPEWSAFSEALVWHIPWVEASMQMRESLPVTLARYPALSPYMSDWLETLYSHVQVHPSPVLHLELSQYFSFSGDPIPYLANIEEFLGGWWQPDESSFDYLDHITNSYLLGGEHHLYRVRADSLEQSTEPDIKVDTSKVPISAVKKPISKRLENLYTWLLALLSAALGLGAYLWTSSSWLAVFAFLVPSLCIIIWELRRRPKKAAKGKHDHTFPSSTPRAIAYYNHISPIKLQGVQAVDLDNNHLVTVPWQYIMLAQVSSFGHIEIKLDAKAESLYPSQLNIVLEHGLEADYVVSAIHSISQLWRLDRNGDGYS